MSSTTTATARSSPNSAVGADRCAAFAVEVARMLAERGSWRRRLEWVRDVLRDDAGADPTILASLSVLLKLVATGAIPCKEDGGHYRPSHHAELGFEIERMLLGDSHRDQLALVRGILRWLPSHDLPFRRAEPLTRIRDIAHRNDIPHDLKDEIKHTLQNKLHRSAGPEDLQTSAALLARFTAPGTDYPEAFVAEFRLFHAELESFFLAGSVEEDLQRQLGELPEAAETPARELLALFPKSFDSAERLDREIAVLTDLRRGIAPAFRLLDEPRGQKLRLLDLKLDERAFVLLSERANRLEAGKERGDDFALVAQLLGVLNQAAEQLALSGVESDFMRVLAVPVQPDSTESTDNSLRLARARFETARTVLGRYAERVLRDCAGFASELGRRLKMPAHVTEQFAEREIRGNLAFQLSRVVDVALRLTADALHLPDWQAVVAGKAEGKLKSVARLDELVDVAEPALLLVDRLDGDEQIPSHVRALLVGHDLPHLSHVAIRCRQSGIPMAARRMAGPTEEWLASRLGQFASLVIHGDGIALRAADVATNAGTTRCIELGHTRLADGARVLSLADVEMDTGGGKAWGARRLAEMARDEHGGFRATDGFVVPFGGMEACLAADPPRANEWRSLLEKIDDPGQSMEAAAERLRQLIETLPLPDALLRELTERCAPLSPVAVRSSSNAEDQKGSAGAGLFESVIGARLSDLATALRTVWASLYSVRALAACRAAGVAARDLAMAVLIQPVIVADLSFVMYTRSPFATTASDGYVELAAGLGETLARASGEGAPYRVHFNRERRDYRFASFLSYPEAIVLDAESGLRRTPVRFHELGFERDRAWRDALVDRLITAAAVVEGAFGAPQDVEGAVVGDEVWFLQSRPATFVSGG